MRNRIISSVIIIMLVSFMPLYCFTGCYKTNGPEKTAVDTSDIIIECIKSKDKEKLKSLFSDYVQKKYDTDKDIDMLFEIFDSDIVSEGQTSISASTESIRDGKTVESSVAVTRYPLVLENGKQYKITFLVKVANKNSQIIGLKDIIVYELNEDETPKGKICVIGTEEIIE